MGRKYRINREIRGVNIFRYEVKKKNFPKKNQKNYHFQKKLLYLQKYYV
jgi:hypothetical protein